MLKVSEVKLTDMIEELIQVQDTQPAPIAVEEVVVAQEVLTETWKPRQRPFNSSPPVKASSSPEEGNFKVNTIVRQ